MTEEFHDLEQRLRNVLRHEDPSPDFARRVVAAAERRRSPWGGVRGWLAAAAAVLAVMGGLEIREYRQGLEAKRQLLTALSITAEKLSVAEQKIEQIQQRRLNP